MLAASFSPILGLLQSLAASHSLLETVVKEVSSLADFGAGRVAVAISLVIFMVPVQCLRDLLVLEYFFFLEYWKHLRVLSPRAQHHALASQRADVLLGERVF